MPKPPLTLYHYYRSSCSWRVRWALELKGIACEMVAVNLLANEQASPAHLARNPSGQVPSLHTNGLYVSESLAMIEWLDECWPTPALLPQGSLERLQARQLAAIIAAGTQPLQNLGAMRFHSANPEAQQQYARHWIHRGLTAYQAQLEAWGCAGTYSLGAEVTIADLCLIPQLYNARRFGIDTANEFSLLARIERACLATRACQASAPERYAPKHPSA